MTKENPMIGIADYLSKEARFEDAQRILKTVHKSKKSTDEDKKTAEKMNKELNLKNREKIAKEVKKNTIYRKTEELKPHTEIEKLMVIHAEDYNRIKDDIDKRGIQVPLVVNDEDKVICGITRFKACQELEIEEVPVFEGKFDLFQDLMDYAIRDNTMRRQLTPDERINLTSLLLREKDVTLPGRPPINGPTRMVEAVTKKATKSLAKPIEKIKEKIEKEKKERKVDKTIEKQYKLVVGKDGARDDSFASDVSAEVKTQIELLKAKGVEIDIYIKYEVKL